MISSSSHMVISIDECWRFIWSLTSGFVGISRGIYKLARILHVNNKKKIKQITSLELTINYFYRIH